MKYSVDLYNKDADNYKEVFTTDDIEIAKQVCKALNELCKKDMIIDREVKHPEPFDWAETYDNENREVVYVDKE